MGSEKLARLKQLAEKRAAQQMGEPEMAVPINTVIAADVVDVEDQTEGLQPRSRQRSLAHEVHAPGKRVRTDPGASPRASKKSRHGKRSRTSDLVVDGDFLRRNLEEYRADPVEAAIKLFRHLGDVTKLQKTEAEELAKGAQKERDDLLKRNEELRTALFKAREDRKRIEAERDSALDTKKTLELRVSDLKKQGEEEALVTATLRARILELEAEAEGARNNPHGRVAELEEELAQVRGELEEVAGLAVEAAGESFEKAFAQIAVTHPTLSLPKELYSVDYDVEEGRIVRINPVTKERVVIYPRPSST